MSADETASRRRTPTGKHGDAKLAVPYPPGWQLHTLPSAVIVACLDSPTAFVSVMWAHRMGEMDPDLLLGKTVQWNGIDDYAADIAPRARQTLTGARPVLRLHGESPGRAAAHSAAKEPAMSSLRRPPTATFALALVLTLALAGSAALLSGVLAAVPEAGAAPPSAAELVEAVTPPDFLKEWGGFGAGPGQFDAPLGIAVNAWGEV